MNSASFFMKNKLLGDLLVVVLVLGGLIAVLSLRREFFPPLQPDRVTVTMIYPGASPAEMEDSLTRKVEDAVIDVAGVDEVTTTVFEGASTVVITFDEGEDMAKRRVDVENAVESLQDLPADAERLRVAELEERMPAIQLNIACDGDAQVLKRVVRQVEEDLRDLDGMGLVLVSGMRPYEVRVQADREALMRHGLSLPRLASAINSWTREVSSGSLKGADRTVSVRTLGTEETAEALGDVVVTARADGSSVRVRDVARVEEGFADEDIRLTVNGLPGATLTVFQSGDQDVVAMAELVRGYKDGVEGKPLVQSGFAASGDSAFGRGWRAGQARGPLPVSMSLSTNLAKIIEDRIDLLSRNAMWGAIFVFLTLLVGVRLRTAWWVMVGIVTAICGTFLVMWIAGLTLNLITMFSLLLVLGMLADDAIVVAESIDTMHAEGVSAEEAAQTGTARVGLPVLASVSTTVVAFIPLAFIGGKMGDIIRPLPSVVAIALGVSLLEALFIAPAHLSRSMRKEEAMGGEGNRLERLVEPFERWRDSVGWPRLIGVYEKIAGWCVHYRYISVSAGVSAFIISLGMVISGRLPFSFMPTDDTETVILNYALPLGTPLEQTDAFALRVAEAAKTQPEVRSVMAMVGQSIDFQSGQVSSASTHLGQIVMELLPLEQRDKSSAEVLDSIRQALGHADEAERLSWTEMGGGPSGADITYELSGPDPEELSIVARELRQGLLTYEGVLDAIDTDDAGVPELQVELRPGAAASGFTPADVAEQLRAAIYGREAHVFTDDGEDIDVRVALADSVRRRAGFLEEAWITSPAGKPVPVIEVARVTEREGYATIRRKDRDRVVIVTADCSSTTIPEDITSAMGPLVDRLKSEHPSVAFGSGGRQKDLQDAFASLPIAAMAAAVMIYVILIWLFGSLWQPFAVMMAIPFGVIGVVWGHVLMGHDLSFLSLIGFVALAGVVVNNSLLVVEFVNMRRAAGHSLAEALVWAGKQRFRAILLTTVTTVAGLGPLVFEQSFQARFLVPMAISLCAGLISAAALTLLLLPAILVIFDDLGRLVRWLWSGEPMRGAPHEGHSTAPTTPSAA